MYNTYKDPFWIWHHKPHWYNLFQGHNPALDLKMRFAKPLQAVLQKPKRIFIGSSRVYRGINTELLPHSYNFGISGLRIKEAYLYINYCLHWLKPEAIVLGLDFFMFDHNKILEEGFPEQIEHPWFFIEGIGTALFSYSALQTSRSLSAMSAPADGIWTQSGFKSTFRRKRSDLIRVNEEFHGDYCNINISKTEYELFQNIINIAKKKNTKLIVFISPKHKEIVDVIKQVGKSSLFNQWRKRIKYICSSNNISFFDFSLDNPFFDEDVSQGSSPHWIDTSHYSPLTGEWLLERIGIK